jgi:hypothetical protein
MGEHESRRRPTHGTREQDRGRSLHPIREALGSDGQPLDAALERAFEPAFGHRFDQVRVHEGDTADQLARDIDAPAFTVGQDVVFAAGTYEPASPDSQHLVAHELAHTMQQSSAPPASEPLSETERGGAAESEADAATTSIDGAAHPRISTGRGLEIARAPWDIIGGALGGFLGGAPVHPPSVPYGSVPVHPSGPLPPVHPPIDPSYPMPIPHPNSPLGPLPTAPMLPIPMGPGMHPPPSLIDRVLETIGGWF